jgi:hypothetical protein
MTVSLKRNPPFSRMSSMSCETFLASSTELAPPVASSTYVRFLRNQAAVSLPTPKRSAVSLTAAMAMHPAGRSP